MEFVTDAEHLLSESWGLDVRICRPALVARRGRAETWRTEVEAAGSASVPASVIVKRAIVQSDCFLEECVGLQFIKGVHTSPPVAPQIIACDMSSRLLVMEDLGPGHSLEDLFGFDDAEGSALSDLAIVTANLHAAAAGREAEYEHVRSTMGVPANAPVRATQASAWRNGLRHVEGVLNTLEIEPPHGLEHEWENVACTVEDPEPFLTYTHGDMAPSNNHFGTAGARLLDFEWGGYRHALYDALYWHTIYPFPPSTIQKADAAYRAALSGTMREIGDDAIYSTALTHMCAHHAFSFVIWWFPAILEQDNETAPGVTSRQMLLFKLDRLAALTTLTGHLEAIGMCAERLAGVLRSRFPEMEAWP